MTNGEHVQASKVFVPQVDPFVQSAVEKRVARANKDKSLFIHLQRGHDFPEKEENRFVKLC